MKVKIEPREKFDQYYEKESSAVMVAIGWIMFIVAIGNAGLDNLFIISNIIFAAVAANWVYHIAQRQNREPGWLSFFAFLLPVPMLIVMGLSRKKNLVFEINTSYPPERQRQALRAYANTFLKRHQNVEAAFVYKYLTGHHGATDEDHQQYAELVSLLRRPVPHLPHEPMEEEIEEEPIAEIIEDIPKETPPIPAPIKPSKPMTKQKKDHIISITYFFFLLFCIFLHMVLVFNKPHKGGYAPDYKLYYLGEEYNDEHYIYPWWTLNFIYFVYVLSAALYYLGYVKLPKRKKENTHSNSARAKGLIMAILTAAAAKRASNKKQGEEADNAE